MLVQSGGTSILIDCGLPTRLVQSYLSSRDVYPDSLTAICITHEHIDHVQSAGVLSRRFGVPIVANYQTIRAAGMIDLKTSCTLMEPGDTLILGSLEVTSFALPHDAALAMGFLVSDGRHRACFATDLGIATPEVEKALGSAQLIVLEANYDHQRLVSGPYPSALKRRIVSDVGHLSNDDCARLIASSLNGQPKWVWLAHLSKMNNSPRMALRTVVNHLTLNGLRDVHVAVAGRDMPSQVWDSEATYYQQSLPLLLD
jgi:phosphoribosyl 1,2-cyclic phosphodiesterase